MRDQMSKIQIICHGGAWSIPDATEQESLRGVREAVDAGYAALREGKAAEDAVVAAVMNRDVAFVRHRKWWTEMLGQIGVGPKLVSKDSVIDP